MTKKKVDEWWYSVDAVMNKQVPKDREDPDGAQETVKQMEEKKVKVEVFLEKSTDEDKTPPHTLKSVNFIVTCKEVDINLAGTDIALLRKAVWEKLDAKYEIQWFEYFKVDIVSSRIYGEDGTGFDFYWDSVWKGICHDGTALLREHVRWSRDGEMYRISAWPGKFTRRDSSHIVACIPKNDTTEAALQDFKERLNLLRERLQDMLTPEAIMNTLTNLSGIALLPQAYAQVEAEMKTIEDKKSSTSRSE